LKTRSQVGGVPLITVNFVVGAGINVRCANELNSRILLINRIIKNIYLPTEKRVFSELDSNWLHNNFSDGDPFNQAYRGGGGGDNFGVWLLTHFFKPLRDSIIKKVNVGVGPALVVTDVEIGRIATLNAVGAINGLIQLRNQINAFLITPFTEAERRHIVPITQNTLEPQLQQRIADLHEKIKTVDLKGLDIQKINKELIRLEKLTKGEIIDELTPNLDSINKKVNLTMTALIELIKLRS